MDYVCCGTLECNQGAVRAVRFSSDGNYCITCGSDKKLKLWNPTSGLFLTTYAGHANDVLDVCGSCDNSQIASCGADKSVILWDVIKAVPLRRLRGHVGSVSTVAFNEDSTVILSGSQDNTVMCWDVKSRQNTPIQVLREATDCITKIRVTDHEIVTASLDAKVRRYDIRLGQIIVDFIGEGVTCISYTADEQCILTSCSDGSVKLFDKDSGELLCEYSGHKTGNYYLESCVDNTDSFVVSGSTDGCLWSWDLVTSAPSGKFQHSIGKVVHSVVSHPSKPEILSASATSVKIWKKKSEA